MVDQLELLTVPAGLLKRRTSPASRKYNARKTEQREGVGGEDDVGKFDGNQDEQQRRRDALARFDNEELLALISVGRKS